MRRFFKWLAVLLLILPVIAVLLIAIFGWNWAREPLQHIVQEKTGRALVIGGDLNVTFNWPAPHIFAKAVTFSNPAWAKEKQMVAVDDVEFSIDLLALLKQSLVFPEVRLTHPVVYLEQAADGRKNWLLDQNQSDEKARIPIGRLTLDQGQLGYDDEKQKTHIRADISTQEATANAGIVFSAKGTYKALPLVANGNGGSILALHDENAPYPLKVDATIGHTKVKVEGNVTSLIKFSAIDVQLALSGESLAQLFPLLGIALPETYPYATSGHLLRSDKTWRYENFSGHMGKSDIAGNFQIDTAATRPFMRGHLESKLLDFDDLGPLIGTRKDDSAPKPAAVASAPSSRVLPEIPFKSDRWNSVDADVTLHAQSIVRAKGADQLPLENLNLHLKMQDSLITLDPLDFGLAGGHLKAVISMNGRVNPIEVHAKISARKILLAKLFPNVKLTKTSIGQINGEFDLSGKGNSVGSMLASADGRVGLVIANGEISKLLMESIGLHLVEIVQLKIVGDKTINLRCGVADFAVKSGIMEANGLVFDTDVSTVVGSGNIDLAEEKLDLTLVPKTRSTSPVALRSPLFIKGTFSKPEIGIDKARLALRGGGALALSLLNPLFAFIPLVEMGPGVESECGRLMSEARK